MYCIRAFDAKYLGLFINKVLVFKTQVSVRTCEKLLRKKITIIFKIILNTRIIYIAIVTFKEDGTDANLPQIFF